jgi:signal transduction histidine kinase
MYQVFSNLLSNAIQNTDSGKVSVDMQFSDDLLKVFVVDTGVGISKQDLPFIFERFYRSESDRSRQSGGSGLGLAIVKSIIMAHNGQLSVASELNQGTTFTIELPIVNTKLTNR